jgi:hypothetical protein
MRRQDVLAIVGLDGNHANINSAVATSGDGWSQGEKQLVGTAAAMLAAAMLAAVSSASAAT